MESVPIIGSGSLKRGQLDGQIVVITGAGRGIGFETARSLAWLGARAVIAEVDPTTGKSAAERINAEMGTDLVRFIQCDVADESSVQHLAAEVLGSSRRVDAVLNNATVTPFGAVKDASPAAWQTSFGVNLLGPVHLARAFIPHMLERGSGTFVCVASSGPAPYMGPYEVMKVAQGALASTLEAELEESGVNVFTIGPGISMTPGAMEGIKALAPMYHKSFEEFVDMSRAHLISPEAAGAGFAAGIALAPQFRGQETSSFQTLRAAGIEIPTEGASEPGTRPLAGADRQRALDLCRKTLDTLVEQGEGFKKRPLFERQWTLRDFRKNAGMPIEQWIDSLKALEAALVSPSESVESQADIALLVRYFGHMADMLIGWEKDPAKRDEHLGIIKGWEADAAELKDLLSSGGAV